jgi:hypothetical protein
MQNSRLKPQARPHALAELEVAIAKAEADRDRHIQIMNRAGDEDGLRRAKAFLRIAEERLAILRHSRDVLLGGEESEEKQRDSDVL